MHGRQQPVDERDRAADAYYALPLHRQRDPDDAIADSAEDDAALTAILQHILDEDSLMGAARRARQAQLELDGWIRAMAARVAAQARGGQILVSDGVRAAGGLGRRRACRP